jgi:methionyl-tRNA formyltransferase
MSETGFHYRDVLVISDNVLQCSRFHKLLQSLEVQKQVNFSWACTSTSSPQDFEREIGISFFHLDLKNDKDVQQVLTSFDLALSMHCKQLFPATLVKGIKCINIHPGYNPVNRGWYPQVFAIINDLVLGATIHEIDLELDHGPIIARTLVEQRSWDTSLELYNRILDAEMKLLQDNIVPILKNRYTTLLPDEEGNLFMKKDFNELCKLDLDETSTFKNFLNRLRALTHGTFRNAFYIDAETGKKVYVSVELKPADPIS